MKGAIAKPKEEKKKYGKYDEWEIESAADSILRAEEVKADKEKMKYVGPCLEKKMGKLSKAIKSIQDLKDIHQEKYASGESEEEEYEES